VDVWFNLGDRDLAIGIERQRMLREGARLTESIARLTSALNIPATVLPMSDDPVRTRVRASGRWRGFQEFMIQARGQGPIEDIEFRGARSARVSDEVLGAVAEARAIVIGPSNPVLSIGPILALAQMRTAIAASRVPVVAVSPLVRGTVVKGPTAACMEWAGWPLSSEGIALAYAGVIDGLIADRPTDQLPVLETDVLMDDPDSRRRLAEQALTFALGLSG
jgi:LPPG:FO 2-phospho-L-lactate transferase